MADRPVFNMLVPIEHGEGDKKRTQWVRFGSLWETKGGHLTGKVDFWPVGAGNRVVLMPPKDSQGGEGGDGEAFDEETGEVSF